MRFLFLLVLISFGALSSVQHVPIMMHAGMNEHASDMSATQMQDCVGDACTAGVTYDCLEHCLATAATIRPDIYFTTYAVSFALIVGLLFLLLKNLTSEFFQRREWYPPFYHFKTVRLLE
ncbi:MAG: hypothetical protein Q8P90_04570 [bacterium]|nr:hypothetical protein [bacterium]